MLFNVSRRSVIAALVCGLVVLQSLIYQGAAQTWRSRYQYLLDYFNTPSPSWKACGHGNNYSGKVTIASLKFEPERPKAGQSLKMSAEYVLPELLHGAELRSQFMIGMFAVNKDYDICNFVSCPMNAGFHTHEMTMNAPALLRGSTVNGKVRMYDSYDREVACLEVEVPFT